ncbi:serine hydrolase domain-containing protein [Winogradskyella sp. PE311]|uniref:serine hydrolase domain-containing protein n=1 Tax=Winogradskyella sp. PE311 TaxID=3366943 RepID=UPI00397F8ECA
MRLFITLFYLCLSLSMFAQRPPIKDLPAISLEEAGFNNDSISALARAMDNFKHKDFRGMMVIKDHKAVMEWYYSSTQRKTINDIRSAGKSITALLLGVAMEKGLVDSLEQDVHSFFSKEKYPSLNDDYKKVKLKHLLDMASGLDADSDDWNTKGNAGKWIGKDNWIDFILSVPLAYRPGEKWIYADINAVLIGAIIEETSGMSLRDFAIKHVFKPLRVTEYYWFTNASNQTGAAGNLYLSTLDLAKLGVLVANKGKWLNKQIVKEDYITKLIEHKVYDFPDWKSVNSYGMFWYKNQLTVNGKEFDYLFASGYGGNHLVVVPEKKLVISLISTAYGQPYMHSRSFFILKKLLGALE